MNISLEQFTAMWDKHCERRFGLGAIDLPDFMCIDDYWFEGMSMQQAKDAVEEMHQEMCDELHFDI
jgi:hypothetical protein